MNWLSVQFWDSTPILIHSSGPNFANGVPAMASGATPTARPPMFCMALLTTTASWSTSVSHGRSVSPFHCERLAFS